MSDHSGHVAAVNGTSAGFGPGDRPTGADDTETAVFDGEVVIYHESRQMVHQLNSTAGTVWLLCDGETEVAAMAIELGELFDMQPTELTEGIYQALNQLAAAGLLAGIDPHDHHLHHEHPELTAPDGSRLMVAPPDP